MLPASVDRFHTRHITEMASLERAARNRNNGVYFWFVLRLSNRKYMLPTARAPPRPLLHIVLPVRTKICAHVLAIFS